MTQIGEHIPDNLLAGDFPRVTEWVNMQQGEGVQKRGTLVDSLGYIISNEGGLSGLYGVLAEDFDAIETKQMPVYLTGEFARNYLYYGNGLPIEDQAVAALRALSIFAKNTVPAA